jgi:outer membrane lipoprotein-sorting protein
MRMTAATLFLFLLLTPPFAARPATADAGDQPVIQAAQDYLNGIVTLQARFTQTSTDGKRATGTFLLKRPGRLRFEYDKPVTDFIVADGSQIYYYDGQMKQASSTKISRSLADFFLRRDLTLSGDIRVSAVKRLDHEIDITLVQTKDPLSGSLTLVLGENPSIHTPLELKAWRVVDSQNMTTEVDLANTQTGIALNNEQFHYVDPLRGTELNH